MLKEQRFGVEVEMTGISRKKAADVLAEVFGTIAGEPDSITHASSRTRRTANGKS
mgnify:CR=1 FL=1